MRSEITALYQPPPPPQLSAQLIKSDALQTTLEKIKTILGADYTLVMLCSDMYDRAAKR